MKVLIGGATGFIGRNLHKHLQSKGHEVLVISRSGGQGRLTWDELKKEKKLPSCDAVVNLAGENILNPFRRWNNAYKQDVRDSRIGTNNILSECIQNMESPPSVLVTSSAVGYYPCSDDERYTEDFKLKPSNWLEQLVLDWEHVPKTLKDNTRHSVIRVGVVLGKDGGIIQNSIWPFWLGLGGQVGSGKQFFPWIHIDDIVGIYTHAIENASVNGALNGVSPEICDNRTFTKEFAAALWRPAIFPVPEFVLNMMLSPERAKIVTAGQNVYPQRTIDSGYSFIFSNLRKALENILKS